MSELTQAFATANGKNEIELGDVVAQTASLLAWHGTALAPELRQAWATAQPFEWSALLVTAGNAGREFKLSFQESN